MICKSCNQEYQSTDALQYSGDHYGWHPGYGDCFLCFCYASFGGMMEPWGNKKVRETQIYKITAPGVHSQCSCSAAIGDPMNWFESREEYESEMAGLEESLDEYCEDNPETDI